MKTQEQEHHRCADHFHRFTIHPNGDVSSWLPSYLVRHDLEVLLDEALEAVEEARSAESCCATPYIQQRDQRLKELARIFRAHDWEGLRDDQLEIKKYSGGLSNKLYRCSSLVDPRQKILIRITGSSSAQQTEGRASSSSSSSSPAPPPHAASPFSSETSQRPLLPWLIGRWNCWSSRPSTGLAWDPGFMVLLPALTELDTLFLLSFLLLVCDESTNALSALCSRPLALRQVQEWVCL